MAISYNNGMGNLYEKDSEKSLGVITYQLVETKPTKYTPGKWWGEFSTKNAIERTGRYILEFEDGRKGICIINTENKEKHSASRFYYAFFGRSKLGKARYGL